MGFITEPHILNKIWIFFNLAFKPLAHLNMFCHFVWDFIRERPNSWERLWGEFFGLCPTESLNASTFSRDFAVNFLPLVDFCAFLVDFINVAVSLNFFTRRVIWNLWGKLLKLNLPDREMCLVLVKHVVLETENWKFQ